MSEIDPMHGESSPVTMISSGSLTDRAIQALKAKILAGELLPGSNHLENELAEMLGISRTPVREALLTLEAQGLVEIIPRRGVRIVPLSPRDMEEIYEILTELESLVAKKAAARSLSEHQLSPLAECLHKMEAALEADERNGWAEADDHFHRRLVALSGNRRLEQTVQTFWDQLRRARLLTLHIRPAPHTSNEDHRALYNAIAEGDPELAARISSEHRTAACRLMVSLLAKHGLRSV